MGGGRRAEADAPRGVLARLRAAYPSLSGAERRVADAVEGEPEAVLRLPVRALAGRIGVSEATVVRACRSLGFGGLKELKLELAAEVLSPERAVHEAVGPGDDAGAIAEKVLRSDMQAISDTLAVLDAAALEAAVGAMLGASRIEVYGVGSSVPVALDAYYRFLRLGLPATVVTDPHMQATSAAHLPEGAVAFAVSHTGRSFETHAALRQAGRAGARRVLLTSFRNTPIGELADVEIVVASPESALRPEAVSSRIAHLAVVDALSVALAVRRPDASREALLKDDEIIAEREVGD